MQAEERARILRIATRTRAAIASALAGIAAAALLAAAGPARAEAPVQPYGSNDAGGFRNVLPAGENGLDNSAQLGEFEFNKTLPKHYADQLPLYGNLPYAAPTLTHEQIGEYFKD